MFTGKERIVMKLSYTISDIIDQEFIRFPLTLLAIPKYKAISLEAKMIYALLLNRLSLSQKNGWINEEKEVYLIYTREEAADMLGISYKKTIAAFKELLAVELIFEVRQGRGFPNLIYVLKAELSDTDAEEFAVGMEKQAENSIEPQTCQNGSSRNADMAVQDLTEAQFKTCQSDTSRPAHSEVQDLSKSQTTKNNISQIDRSKIEKSPSVSQADFDRQTDELRIHDILSCCELKIFPPEAQQMFTLAIERLYYSESLKAGNAVLPQTKLRSYLNLLDTEVLTGVYDKLCRDKPKMKNRAAYLMVMIMNELLEKNFDSLRR